MPRPAAPTSAKGARQPAVAPRKPAKACCWFDGQKVFRATAGSCKVGAVYTLGQLLPSNLFKSVVAYQHSSTATVKPFKIKTYRRWQDAAPHAYPKAP